jgi:RND family efflux transporter MFP subunit
MGHGRLRVLIEVGLVKGDLPPCLARGYIPSWLHHLTIDMSSPAPDLSRLKIDRDQPSAGSLRALRFSIGLAVLAVVFAAAVWWFLRGGGASEVSAVRVEIVGSGAGQTVGITANGYVVARTKASVSSKISGRLAFLGVAEGSFVRKGEVMARLENQDYAAAVAQVEAEELRAGAALREAIAVRDQLQRDLARGEELLVKNLIAEQGVEDLRARLQAADARVDVQEAQVASASASVGVARANLGNTLIRAPFTGTVLRKDAEVGEVVAPMATGGGLTRGAVVTMADLETLEVEVDVNEAYIAQIKSQQPTRIVLDAYPAAAFEGAVRQIVPTADRQRATVQVKVSILEKDSRILPEMGARVEFLETADRDVSADAPARIFVPANAVQSEGAETVVWVIRDGSVSRTLVDAGPVSGATREIRSGLSGGEQLVVHPPNTLADGARVHVITP